MKNHQGKKIPWTEITKDEWKMKIDLAMGNIFVIIFFIPLLIPVGCMCLYDKFNDLISWLDGDDIPTNTCLRCNKYD